MPIKKKVVKETGKATSVKSKKAAKIKKTIVTPEQRLNMISEAAYYRAERQGFEGVDANRNWLEAEQEINEMLNL